MITGLEHDEEQNGLKANVAGHIPLTLTQAGAAGLGGVVTQLAQ
jgi:hypothetical protein